MPEPVVPVLAPGLEPIPLLVPELDPAPLLRPDVPVEPEPPAGDPTPLPLFAPPIAEPVLLALVPVPVLVVPGVEVEEPPLLVVPLVPLPDPPPLAVPVLDDDVPLLAVEDDPPETPGTFTELGLGLTVAVPPPELSAPDSPPVSEL